MPKLAEVRDSVSLQWGNARRLEANEQYFQDLLKGWRLETSKDRHRSVNTVNRVTC